MKVTLDLGRLLEQGAITKAEYEKLQRLGATGTGSTAFNVLLGFGVTAVGAGVIFLVPDAITGVAIGAILILAGLAIYGAGLRAWEMLGHICVLVGALTLGGGVTILANASIASFLAIAAGFAIAGTVARSALLVVLAVLALASTLGARTDYMHAMYFFGMEQPSWSILVFSVLALAAYQVAKRVPADYERLALAAARVSILLVNLAFWIGSLWGDDPAGMSLHIPDWAFVAVWAVALVGAGLWAASANRPWLVNTAAVFGAIHFYTQWFERLGPEPGAVLLGGLIALGFAAGFWYFNRRLWDGALVRVQGGFIHPSV